MRLIVCFWHSFHPIPKKTIAFDNVDPWYFEVGESIMKSLILHTKVEGGFASVRDVTTMQLEDHQHSFFLSETYELFLSPRSVIQKISLVITLK